MKTFGTLCGYELKKLLKRKLTWAVAIVMTGFSIFAAMGGLNRDGGIYFEEAHPADIWHPEIVEFIPENEWNARMTEGGRRLDGQIMDDAFFEAMAANVPDPSELEQYRPDLDLAPGERLNFWFYHEDPTYYFAYEMADTVTDGDPRELTAEEFYEGRRAVLEQKWRYLGLTEEEKDVWRAMEEQREEPYRYRTPWEGICRDRLFSSSYALCMPLALMPAVCLCPVFSEERSRRVEPLLLVCRSGRLPLYLAKTVAGILAAGLVWLLVAGSHMAVYLICFGTAGLDAPVQAYSIMCSLNISIGHLIADILLLYLLYTLIFAGLTALVSVVSGRTVVALLVPTLLMLSMSWHRNDWVPVNLWDMLGKYNRVWRVSGGGLHVLQVGTLLYALTALLLFSASWIFWRRRFDRGD